MDARRFPAIILGTVLATAAALVAPPVLSTLAVPAHATGTLAPAAPDAADPLPHRTDLSAKDRARVARVLAPPSDPSVLEPFEPMPGGGATTRIRRGPESFRQPAGTLATDDLQTFGLGNALFRKLWVAAPSSTQASDGLGPLYNARACDGCHINDGRGRSAGGEGFILRLATLSPDGAAAPHPLYGAQLQDRAAPGLPREGAVAVTWTEEPVTLADGTVVSLRRPTYAVAEPGYGPPDPPLVVSPRVAPPMIGLGLLEAIHEGDILAGADPDDANGDGISGRPNFVPDPAGGGPVLGRFGWKAGAPTLSAQTAQAFAADMGLSTTLHPAPAGDCTAAQPDCLARPHGVQPRLGPVEIPDPVLDLVTFYARTVAAPVRETATEPSVLAGKAVFHAVGCAACHTPKFVTRRDAALPALAFQLVWPYSDLLLHDMGEALADALPEGDATGREWRTAPLWGLGHTQAVSGRVELLHDGRARSVLEAILWHGGEAAPARDRVVALSTPDREALLAFLASL
ncbi:di-heme oxidoredictase family protein [Mongoliimonas terrestris]|uniref:di-heme oxidoreductase family protein n=1 Tax=Mongoliimonas terrestris TaxID=1709001 RepID=UPI0009F8CB16|nr:di-heme oxidoredictase family protein [Mongoliimonas terrestris]